MTSSSTDILYADDHDLVRETVADLLARHFETRSVRTFEDATSALDQAQGADLVILDWNMPGMGDGSVIPEFQSANPDAMIVVLSGIADPDIVRAAITLGIQGYIPKSYAPKQMLAALDFVMAGQRFIPDLAFDPDPCTPAPLVDPEHVLTAKEKEILETLAGGQSNKHIAREHDISETTVKSHLKSIFAKMGFQSRGEAMSYVLLRKR